MGKLVDMVTWPLRAPVRGWVLRAFPRSPTGATNYDQPLGDPGLFGPDSVTWRIHADFPGMLSGGLSALMMQTLHPLALAGIWDHSRFRDDLVGRLRRTTGFIGLTTYAPRAAAQAAIERVRRIHQQVRGVAADGRAYSAQDPELLTWVHATEMHSFLAGFRRYSGRALPAWAADRYLDEMRRIAEALGARDVPASQAALAAYFDSVLPQLEYTERSRTVLNILAGIRLPVPVPGVSRSLFLGAGTALLPGWAMERLELGGHQRRQARLAAAGLRTLAPVFRAALREGIAARSCRRMGVAPESLSQFPERAQSA
ncbi:MAG: oxygenase MpaB family protein [Xanthomonadales bacterium]|nr:oxygenase MpaB family protein [Xanthomonadales bacterium]